MPGFPHKSTALLESMRLIGSPRTLVCTRVSFTNPMDQSLGASFVFTDGYAILGAFGRWTCLLDRSASISHSRYPSLTMRLIRLGNTLCSWRLPLSFLPLGCSSLVSRYLKIRHQSRASSAGQVLIISAVRDRWVGGLGCGGIMAW